MSVRALAKVVRVVQDPNADEPYVFDVDGQMFPWYVGVDGFQIGDVSRGTAPTITITIPCERLELVHSLLATK